MKDMSLRKRQQIAKASRVMFLWVAAASIIVGASGVIVFVLTQKLIFNEKVLAEKSKTVSTLEYNNSIVEQLKSNIRVLNTNQSLINLRSQADTEPVQVVFDSLPSSANSAALGASLQSQSLLGQDGIKIESLDVKPVSGVEDTGDDSDASTATSSSSTTPSIEFSFSVSTSAGNAGKLKDLLGRLEKSIRSINVTDTKFENQTDKLIMTVTGVAYYEPAQQVKMTEKAVRP